VETLLTVVHVLVCVCLILVVLLQSGRAADLAGAFGGAGSQTAFGPRGAATFLSRATSVLAIVFMLTSLGLAVYASRTGKTGSVLEQTPPPAQQQTAPTEPPAGEQPAGTPAPSGQPAPQQPAPSQPPPP
jgi:preprotein translocase subunit SecG